MDNLMPGMALAGVQCIVSSIFWKVGGRHANPFTRAITRSIAVLSGLLGGGWWAFSIHQSAFVLVPFQVLMIVTTAFSAIIQWGHTRRGRNI